jgi:hypothetical protein
VPVASNTACRFRLRATDGASNVGAWSTTTKTKTSLVQETALGIAYTGAFKRVALAGSSGGYVRQTSVAGRIATFSFTGSSMAFVTTTGPNRGIAKVRLDGGSWLTIDLYSASLQTKMLEMSASFIRAHTRSRSRSLAPRTLRPRAHGWTSTHSCYGHDRLGRIGRREPELPADRLERRPTRAGLPLAARGREFNLRGLILARGWSSPRFGDR